jgi:CheY-like chemotaxis protein
MSKRVLDVGNCPADHAAIQHLIEVYFDAQVVQAHTADDALATLDSAPFDLVLVNRKLDRDNTDGLQVIRRIRAIPQLAHIPVMLVTNFVQHQQQAVREGAEPGFGKRELQEPATRERMRQILG